jgi:hypothetical protein
MNNTYYAQKKKIISFILANDFKIDNLDYIRLINETGFSKKTIDKILKELKELKE